MQQNHKKIKLKSKMPALTILKSEYKFPRRNSVLIFFLLPSLLFVLWLVFTSHFLSVGIKEAVFQKSANLDSTSKLVSQIDYIKSRILETKIDDDHLLAYETVRLNARDTIYRLLRENVKLSHELMLSSKRVDTLMHFLLKQEEEQQLALEIKDKNLESLRIYTGALQTILFEVEKTLKDINQKNNDMRNGAGGIDISTGSGTGNIDTTTTTRPSLPKRVSIKALPNPSGSNFLLKVNIGIGDRFEEAYVTIYSLTGRVIDKIFLDSTNKINNEEGSYLLNTDISEGGEYFYRVTIDNETTDLASIELNR